MAGRKGDIKAKVARWFGLSHPPFQMVGLLPFLLGTFLAWRLEHAFALPVFILVILGVVLVMLSTYHAGEFFDEREDERAKGFYRNRLAGGSGSMPGRPFSASLPFWISITTITLAAIIGLVLQFGLKTGPLTLLLGCIGTLPGLFYALRPLHLDENGLGEISIGFCYGWLPVASAFYIQTGTIASCIHWMALTIGLSIFNVILLDEFPDHPAEAAAGKTNLLDRLGKDRGVTLYVFVSILSWVSMYWSLGTGIPRKALYFYLPIMAMSAAVSFMMARRKYENPLLLEILCGLNIAVNLGTTLVYLLAFA